MRRRPWLALCALIIAACGDNLNQGAPKPDGGSIGDQAVCGNSMMEPGEECDDGMATMHCSADCKLMCGNGVVDDGEACDKAIAAGDPGACPSTCDDNDACTTDTPTGSKDDCSLTCVHGAITAPTDGDGCCPAGANANTDDDCLAACGNGVVEAGETCDTGILTGPGSCPTTCDDGVSCTTDMLVGTMCTQACTHTDITQPHNGDGCCPTGANSGNDNDCPPGCGNGVVDPGETCDTAIAPGMPGACPTSCSDGNSCTTDVLDSGGTCLAECVFVPITNPTNNDGCCPTGANANNDNDCQPVCGNGVVEGTEQCDDGNTNNDDGCSNSCTLGPTAYRLNDLDIRDPHIFVDFIGCHDVTDNAFFGFAVNGSIQTAITTDGDSPPDGLLDLSPTLVFRPLQQQDGMSTPLDVYFADCTAPIGSTSCHPGTLAPQSVTATAHATGTCLAPIAGTTHTGYTTITTPTGPCFATSATSVTLTLAGIPITLHDARVGGTFSGSPANQLVNGLLIGFISEADANATILPASLPVVGGKPLSSLLAGGSGACPSYSDKDTDNGVVGWWFYLNFAPSPAAAVKVPWSDN